MDWSSVARASPGMDVRHLIATAGQAAGVLAQLAIHGLPEGLLPEVGGGPGGLPGGVPGPARVRTLWTQLQLQLQAGGPGRLGWVATLAAGGRTVGGREC
jgi:hypothetical protein